MAKGRRRSALIAPGSALRPRRSFQATAPSLECRRSATVGAVKVSSASPRPSSSSDPRSQAALLYELGTPPSTGSLMRGLPECHLATVIRRLSNGVDQTMQVDRGLEGRLMTFAVTDCLSE